MAVVRILREWGALWLGLIAFILIIGALRGMSRGLDALNDFGPLLMGAIFVSAMVVIGMAVVKLAGWIGRLFKRA